MRKTISEALFEQFCQLNDLAFTLVPVGHAKSVDYNVLFGPTTVAVEIEQIESSAGFGPGGRLTRKLGSHIRYKITEARAQVQEAARTGMPAILLVHNTVDPHQLFGTEEMDFFVAMYGELTVQIRRSDGKLGTPYLGRNARLREDANTSFSGVGHLMTSGDGPRITIYENAYAANPLPFASLPPCIDMVRVTVESAD
jgi:hypothetical protein